MKYIVECEKKVKCVFVVDAEDDEQCHRKLTNGEYEFKHDIPETKDSYLGYEYIKHDACTGNGIGAVICSIEDLCRELGTTVDDIERYMYKNTECGMPIAWDSTGIELVGYVEGADCDGPSEHLLFPFTMAEFDTVVEYLESEADVMWHEWNDEEDEEDDE